MPEVSFYSSRSFDHSLRGRLAISLSVAIGDLDNHFMSPSNFKTKKRSFILHIFFIKRPATIIGYLIDASCIPVLRIGDNGVHIPCNEIMAFQDSYYT